MKKDWLTVISDGKDTILDVRSEDENGVLQIFEGETLLLKQTLNTTHITIPEGVTKIEDYAFDGDDFDKIITSIKIPSSTQTIGTGAFNGCTNLKSIIVDSSNAIYDSRNNCNAIIEAATNTLIKGCQNTVIPDDVKSIGECAFVGCSPLTTINLPNGLEEIGVCAFAGTGLTEIVFPPSLKIIDDNAFGECLGLTNINVPEGVTYINRDAFRNCRNLALISLPKSALPFEGYFAECPCKVEIYTER